MGIRKNKGGCMSDNKIECPFVQVSDKNNCIMNTLKIKKGKTKYDIIEWLRYQER